MTNPLNNSLLPSTDFDMSIASSNKFSKEELLNLMRQDLMQEVQSTIMPQVLEQIEKEKQIALTVMNDLQQKATKFESQIERQEQIISHYKRDVKALNQEISSMAHKNVQKEEQQLEKDKKIAILESKLNQMQLETANFRLDELDKLAKHNREISIIKACIITLATGGLGVHTLIDEGSNESIIRSQLPHKRYHEAVKYLQALKADNPL